MIMVAMFYGLRRCCGTNE